MPGWAGAGWPRPRWRADFCSHGRRRPERAYVLDLALPLRWHEPGEGARPLPDLSLKDARELARQDRARIRQGVDVAAEKRTERLKARERLDAAALARAWYDCHIVGTCTHPEVAPCVIRRHINPVIGKLPTAPGSGTGSPGQAPGAYSDPS